jgi:hypothetical protein
MAEEMDAVRENDNRSNDTSTTETAQPTNANAEKQSSTPKYGGLRAKIGKDVGGKDKAAGQNVATTSDSSKAQTTAPTETKTDSKPKEKDALTKETGEEKAAATDNKQAEETDNKVGEDAKEPTTVAPINTATPQSVTWKELRTMLNEKTFLSLTYKVQLSPTFFNTVCPSTLQGKEDVVKLLQELKASDTTFGSDKSFTGKQAALQQMMASASTIAQNLQAMLGGEMNAIQRLALQAYSASVSNYVQSLQRKINNNQVVWNHFFGNIGGFKLEEAMQTDKDFAAKLLEYSKKEASSENVEAYLAIEKGMTPKKFMFGTLFTGLKDDAATVDKLLKDPQMRSKYLALNLPNPILVEMLQAYKDQKMGSIKKGMKKQVSKELLANITDTFSRFAQTNPTADQV